jgi:hypothetical protein
MKSLRTLCLERPGAPAFDLLPDITGRGAHTLSFRSSFVCPNNLDLMTIADEWNVNEAGKSSRKSLKPCAPSL